MTGHGGRADLLVTSAGKDLPTGSTGRMAQPRAEPSAWRPDRSSYQFECETAPGPDRAALTADEYRGGIARLVFLRRRARVARTPGLRRILDAVLSPDRIDFAGMPSPRFWEMENGRIEFAHIDATTTDVAKLLLTEFVLLFGNDWCVVPLELSDRHVHAVDGLLVTDVFGEQTWSAPPIAARARIWHNWRMYLLSGDGDGRAPGCSWRLR